MRSIALLKKLKYFKNSTTKKLKIHFSLRKLGRKIIDGFRAEKKKNENMCSSYSISQNQYGI
jgi:hypothetical protein